MFHMLDRLLASSLLGTLLNTVTKHSGTLNTVEKISLALYWSPFLDDDGALSVRLSAENALRDKYGRVDYDLFGSFWDTAVAEMSQNPDASQRIVYRLIDQIVLHRDVRHMY